MIIESIPTIKKRVRGAHGETSLYQNFWEGEAKPESMKAFTNFARITIRPGGTNRVHTHKGIEQVYIVLRGGGTVQVGDEKVEVEAGDAIFLPRDIGHGFFNTTDKIAVLLLIGCGGEYSYPTRR